MAKRAASRGQTTYHLRPRSTARIGRFPSWAAAKRARSALNGGPRRSSRTRRANNHFPDWASLGDGPAGLIAELVLADDLADYIRLRAVCRPWRRCSPSRLSCGALDRRFHPRRWIMMAHDQRAGSSSPTHRRHFLNVSTGQCVQVDIPELRVLNPLTRQVAELPPIAGGLLRSAGFTGTSPRDSAGLADDQTVVLYLCRIGTLAFAKPGDERWTLVKSGKLLMPTMSFAGRFYGVTSDAVMAVETGAGGSLPVPPRLVVAATLAKPFSRMADTVHMVDNGGELVLVRSRMREIPGVEEDDDAEDCFRREYKVYRVDLDAGKTTKTSPGRDGLGGRAVFIGRSRAVSVSPLAFPCIGADTIYPGLDLDERGGYERIGAYDLTDGSIEHSDGSTRSSLLPRPWSIADCLLACVSG